MPEAQNFLIPPRIMHDHAVRLILSFFSCFHFFFRGGGGGESFFLCLGEGRNAYIFPLPLTYHEGTIVTVFYTPHWHRAIFFIKLLYIVYLNHARTEGIHIFKSLSSHLVFKLVVDLRLVIVLRALEHLIGWLFLV